MGILIRNAFLVPGSSPNCLYHILHTVVVPVKGAYRFYSLLPDWVIRLGPEKDGLYEYSVATDPMRMGLYVLARDAETFRLNYEQEVLLFVRGQGFNKPIPIPQNDKCLYPPSKTLNRASSVYVTPVPELDITKYLGLWYEVS